ncbi:MAG: primosomal protein N' [Bacilli bacterium]|nr:primosomal protein N' [Bacilli bacterium]
MYAKVIIEIGVKNVDKMFTYIVPDNMKEDIKVGCRVKVKFGSMVLEGFVLELTNAIDKVDYELKEIIELVDKIPILNKEMLELGKKIQEITLCSLISAYQVMLPKALKASIKTNINTKLIRYAVSNRKDMELMTYIENTKYEKQREFLKKLIVKKKIKVDKLESYLNTLEKNGLIKFIYEEDYRYKFNTNNSDTRVILNNEQEVCVNKVVNSFGISKTFLLYGVTGSGKTEVYMNIIEKAINKGMSAIMLVPEISLTPQIVERFALRFGDNIAILHSGLSDAEKYDEYRKITMGKVRIVVGARSAIFAPLTNIGVIIIDEEHTATYKQENHPRYHARDIAILRSEYHNCPIVLGSATPSLESFARAMNKNYELLVMKKRANNMVLPDVHIVDMKEEIKRGNYTFSKLLIDKINEKISKGEQVILLLNRRGYSPLIKCSKCGEVEKCPNCDISLTYHKSSDSLRCHYCNYTKKCPSKCMKCGSTDIKGIGLGTEKLEQEIIDKFKARVIRMDADTTSKKGMHEKIIKEFGLGKYDILLGTQMIAKGLDFPKVTLVGVINADMSLCVPDFRSSERTFQLLSQVSGRAGRGKYPGEVIIQTFNPNHYSIRYAKNHDYLNFYKEEMAIRKQLNYSPYYFITLVRISCKDYEEGFKHANKIKDYLEKNLSSDTILLGPTMASMFKINNIYNYQCIIKYKKDLMLKDTLINIDNIYKTNNKVNVEIDVDPIRL